MDASFIFWGYLFLNLMLSGLVAYAASEKGRDPFGFFGVSFLFSFLVGILILLAVPNKSPIRRSNYAAGSDAIGEGEFECPTCAESIKLAAKKCRFCGADVERDAQAFIARAERSRIESEEVQKAETEMFRIQRQSQIIARQQKWSSIKSSRAFPISIGALSLVIASSIAWVSLNPTPPTELESKTKSAPESTYILADIWLDVIQRCGFSATYGYAHSERIYQSMSGKVIWSMTRDQDSLSLDVDMWNASKAGAECVSKNIFGTSLVGVRAGRPMVYQNGFSQGVEVSTEFTGEAQASGYYFRWSR